MAGITTTAFSSSFLFKPISNKSSLLGACHICFINKPKIKKLVFERSRGSVCVVSARFGGGFRSSSGGGGGGGSKRSREPRKIEAEDDPALDIDSLRSNIVRLIDANQNMIGLVSKDEAMQIAEEAELDLVILSPEADPPVVKIMDYSKYRYEQQKKKREQQKKSLSTRMDMKELKMGYNIDIHDYSVRFRAAEKFLKDGDRVKVVVQLKGREKQFRGTAIEVIRRFQTELGELAVEESKNFREKNIFVVLVPNKAALTKAQDQSKKKEKTEATEKITEEGGEVTEVIPEVSVSVTPEEVKDVSEVTSEVSASVTPKEVEEVNEVTSEVSANA